MLGQIIKDAGTLVAFQVGGKDNDRLAKAFSLVNPDSLSSTSDGSFYVRTGSSEPRPTTGHTPDELDQFKTNSFERVVKNSRWRLRRPPCIISLKLRDEASVRAYRDGGYTQIAIAAMTGLLISRVSRVIAAHEAYVK